MKKEREVKKLNQTAANVIVVFFTGALFFAFMKGLSEGTLDKY